VLLADRWVPGGTGDRAQPTVLVRSPYGRRGLVGAIFGRLLAERGFQVVIQSVRGTFGFRRAVQPVRRASGRSGHLHHAPAVGGSRGARPGARRTVGARERLCTPGPPSQLAAVRGGRSRHVRERCAVREPLERGCDRFRRVGWVGGCDGPRGPVLACTASVDGSPRADLPRDGRLIGHRFPGAPPVLLLDHRPTHRCPLPPTCRQRG
jgi:hypothetical protein